MKSFISLSVGKFSRYPRVAFVSASIVAVVVCVDDAVAVASVALATATVVIAFSGETDLYVLPPLLSFRWWCSVPCYTASPPCGPPSTSGPSLTPPPPTSPP